MSEETIVQTFWRRVSETPDRSAIMHKVDGIYTTVNWSEHGKIVRAVASALIEMGVQTHENIAILSLSRPHWTWSDLAALSCGCATVPVYPTLTSPEVYYLVNHSDAVCLFVENARQARKILENETIPGKLKTIVIFDNAETIEDTRVRIVSWNDFVAEGENSLERNSSELKKRIDEITLETMISIVYTSGTTGVPKGVMLRHSNIASVCASMSELVGFEASDLSLSFLPLSHVYERVGGQFLAIYQGLTMAYAESMEAVPKNLSEVKPTVLNGVPRFYEKAYQRIQAEIRNLPKPQQIISRWAFGLGERAERYRDSTKGDAQLSAKFYRSELKFADRIVFSKIRRRFGGRLRIMCSGAAPLSPDVQRFFNMIGLPIVEGYGLTETSAPLSCNTPANNRIGTVGQALPGVQVKLADDGEIMVKGPNVFAGYYKNEAATQEVFQDGWFLTGDIGEIDAEGFIKIVDRKKDLIITSGGKHVAPQYVENLFKGERMISNILVYGDKRKFITALITLNSENLESFAVTNDIAYSDYAQLTQHPKVREELEKLVTRKNDELATFERIKRFHIMERDFSADENELTPTFKMKRKAITEKFQKLLDSLYDAVDLEGAYSNEPKAK